jgi:hypothetical protein
MNDRPQTRNWAASEARIFVQIASYRDPELPRTIRSCLDNARFPERLVFGICFQYGPESVDDLDDYREDPRFRIDLMDYKDSRGCCWARHRVNHLFDGEEFTLQIDAHMRFAPQWDDKLIGMLEKIDHDKPLLTTYPPSYRTKNGTDNLDMDSGVQRLILVRMNRDLTTCQKTEIVSSTERPGKSPFIAAGFIFTLGRFCHEVEYDPRLYFAGEEIAMAARAFTHGYNFYYPTENVIWHYYDHPAPLHWTDHQTKHSKLHANAVVRMKKLLTGKHKDLGTYGLGSVRGLEDYEKYAGIDFKGTLERGQEKRPTQFSRRVTLNTQDIEDRDDYECWVFCLMDDEEEELYRDDIVDQELLTKQRAAIDIDVKLEDTPTKYLLWPKSREGWGPRLVYDL